MVRILWKVDALEPIFIGDSRTTHTNEAGVMSLLYGAYSKGLLCKPLDMRIDVSDKWPAKPSTVGIGGTKEQVNDLVPSGFWYNWRETGMYDTQALIRTMVNIGQYPYLYDKLKWIGTHTHWLRKEAVEWSKQRYENDTDLQLVSWSDQDSGNKGVTTQGYATMVEQARYYSTLIDFPGLGYSQRLPILLASGRPVIVVNREIEAWFYHDGLIPWKHYIPAEPTVQGIEQAWEWVKKNRPVAENIGKQGQLCY